MQHVMVRVRKALIVLAALALLLVVPVGSAGALEPDVEGVASFAEECGGQTSAFTLVLEGELSGCLYTHGWVAKVRPDGTYIEEGTETIAACWGDLCGTLETTYRFVATFDGDGNQTAGWCDHHIVSGTGDFAGAGGGIQFNDDLDAGVAYFHGVIELP